MEAEMETRSYFRKKRRASLTFEWIVITTLLVVGVISALGVLREALNRTAEIIPENICNISTEITTVSNSN